MDRNYIRQLKNLSTQKRAGQPAKSACAGGTPNAAYFFAPIGLIQDLKGAFGVRRLAAALEIVFWPGNGSLLPFSGETNAWQQAHGGHPGSKLPVWGSTRLLKAATSRRTPNAPWAPCVKNYAALGGMTALRSGKSRTSLGFVYATGRSIEGLGWVNTFPPCSVT